MLIAKPTSYNNVIHHSHFPRDAMTHIHGLHHTIIVVIAVSASVGGVLVTFLFWRCLSRNARRAPLPPRQALVHQREQQLAAFTGHRGIIIPGDVLDSLSPVSVCHGSDASLIPHVNSSANTLRTSLHTHETEDGPESQSISYQNPLHPTPHLSVPHSPLNASSASLPSSNNHSLSATGSTTASPSQSIRRTHPRPRPRPFSIVSNGTSHTTMTARSRSSTRGAPHAPHNNVQIILPAPLAPNLYPSANGDNWRRGLADKWIPVGQHSIPEPKSVKPQRSRSMERRGRQAQSERARFLCCSESACWY